jgi:exodeoxyribonuclease VII large subunit
MEGQLQREAQRLDHLAHRLQQRHPVARLAEQGRHLEALRARAEGTLRTRLEHAGLRVDAAARRLRGQRPEARLRELEARLARLRRDLRRATERTLQSQRERLAGLKRTLDAVGPDGTIARGYAVLLGPDGRAVTRVGQVDVGDTVTARVTDGALELGVKGRRPR